jgi:hypothetical protein
VIGEPAPTRLPEAPPLLEVQDAVNVRIGLPLSPPGVKATTMDALPRVTLVIVGGNGGPSADAGPAARPRRKQAATSAAA